ncbi:hypothetical protein EYF80_063969 [Liparis tanakae]|uniref:Uncharacterized protein n=1 Tax=Liparis tanakae TaxID=230148 RepID=A0A4Z2EAX2_9TELE|nr:hypothetical protein EYF80_063969 [Liparis tanakae]
MDGGLERGRRRQPDTVASVSADAGRTPVGSQRAPRAEVCQTRIDVWERCLGRTDGRRAEGLMTAPAWEKLCVCVCVCEVERCMLKELEE